MGHNIDTSLFNIRTDLAIEEINSNIENIEREEINNVHITTITIDDSNKNYFYKKKGKYITIEYEDVTDHENYEEVEEIFIQKLKELLLKYDIKKDSTCLVIGLGNENSTPDSLGPKVINDIIVTNHFYKLGINVEDGFRCVSAINPGVMGQTGIETFDIINSVVKEIKPNFIIVIDALKASSSNKVNKTIQITDAGINPGSGIGNNRKEINKELLGIPVFAVGVPTVVDVATIIDDSIKCMTNYYSYMKSNIDNPKEKLKIIRTNYDNSCINLDDKKELFGIFGSLNDDDCKSFIYEVLISLGNNMIVTPKDIDFQIKKMSNLLSSGINNVLHDNVDEL